MSLKVLLFCSAVFLTMLMVEAKLKGDDCEGNARYYSICAILFTTCSLLYYLVCIQFLAKFRKRLVDNEVGSSKDAIEMELLKACKEAKGKEERLVRSVLYSVI